MSLELIPHTLLEKSSVIRFEISQMVNCYNVSPRLLIDEAPLLYYLSCISRRTTTIQVEIDVSIFSFFWGANEVDSLKRYINFFMSISIACINTSNKYYPCHNLYISALGGYEALVFLRFFIFCPGGITKTYPEANSSRCWMKSPKVDENGFKWMKMVNMDKFLVTRMFFWSPNFVKNRSEVQKFCLLAKFS